MIKWIRQNFEPFYYRGFLIRKYDRKHQQLVNLIAHKGFANVVFIASNLNMWRYQGIYDLMKQDPRFRTTILLVPFNSYSDDQKKQDINSLINYFKSIDVPFEDTTTWPPEKYSIRKWLDPDIIFYTQQYPYILGNSLDNRHFLDRLLCFAPYGVGTISTPWAVNSCFQNIAWRLFYETEIFRNEAVKSAYNHGKNVVVVGNTNADRFLNGKHGNPWKEQSKPKKRVIWAPHFAIEENKLLHRNGFLWLHDIMLEIAQDYKDTIQFAFKPHPRLKSVLYSFPEWGKDRTDRYYETWATIPNTQLEDASFFDLFMTSDALIHDCASFSVEYHYSKKPCLFTAKNTQEILSPLNELGRSALEAHYWGNSEEDVRRFLNETVLAGVDPKKNEREAFFNKYLLPPNGKTTAQNIYDNIVNSIWK